MSSSPARRPSSGFGSPANPIRIVVADDHPVVRFGVKQMLLSESGYEVVGEAEDGDDAITQTIELEPDILLLDLQMPRLPGLEAMRAIVSRSSGVKIILLTATISTQQIIEALQIGARGVVEKASVSGELSRSQAARPDRQGRRQQRAQDLRPDATRARSGQLNRRRLLQQRHRQDLHHLRRDGEAAPVQHLRQDRCFHPPGAGALRHRPQAGPARRLTRCPGEFTLTTY